MTDKEQKVSVSVFNWGPCVVKLKMMDEFKQLLMDEAKNNKQDYRDKLAGIIEKETGYTEEAKAKIVPPLSNYLGVYDQMFERFVNKKYKKKPEYVLSAIWINYQKQGETYQSFFPEEGDIFIFPAWLKHWVAPFKSDVTRISVSGNVHDSAPLNNIVNFAPQYLKRKT